MGAIRKESPKIQKFRLVACWLLFFLFFWILQKPQENIKKAAWFKKGCRGKKYHHVIPKQIFETTTFCTIVMFFLMENTRPKNPHLKLPQPSWTLSEMRGSGGVSPGDLKGFFPLLNGFPAKKTHEPTLAISNTPVFCNSPGNTNCERNPWKKPIGKGCEKGCVPKVRWNNHRSILTGGYEVVTM